MQRPTGLIDRLKSASLIAPLLVYIAGKVAATDIRAYLSGPLAGKRHLQWEIVVAKVCQREIDEANCLVDRLQLDDHVVALLTRNKVLETQTEVLSFRDQRWRRAITSA